MKLIFLYDFKMVAELMLLSVGAMSILTLFAELWKTTLT